MAGLLFPKEKKKKKRIKRIHKNSIVQEQAKCCYLCATLHDDYSLKQCEKHHIFNGPYRKASDIYGLTVQLCVEHHRTGPEAVHLNIDSKRFLQREGQKIFEQFYGRDKFIAIFEKNYLDEEV